MGLSCCHGNQGGGLRAAQRREAWIPTLHCQVDLGENQSELVGPSRQLWSSVWTSVQLSNHSSLDACYWDVDGWVRRNNCHMVGVCVCVCVYE